MNKASLKFFVCVAFFSLLFSDNLFSQSTPSPGYDTAYVDKSPSKYSLRLYTASKENHLYLFHQKWADRITFQPETKFAAGLGFSIKNFGIDLGGAVYKNSVNPDQKTTGFNFIGSLYGNRNVADITFQINNGFTESAKDSTGATKNITRNDVHAFNFGVNYNYIFNYSKYSFSAPFIGTRIQKKSAGSFMLGIFFSDINITSDSTLVSNEFSSQFNPDDLAQQTNVFSGGFTGGYAYTLVLPYRFFITASLTPGMIFSLGEAQRDSFNLLQNLPLIGAKLMTRDAIGYGGRKFYALASYSLDLNFPALGKKNFLLYDPQKIKIVFGYLIK
jgi:hypothetical protein